MLRAQILAAALATGVVAAPFDYHSVRGREGSAADRDGVYEGETHFALKGKSRVQGMGNFGPHWSGDAHLLWDGIVGEPQRR